MAQPCDNNRGACTLICSECPVWHEESCENVRFKQLYDLAMSGNEEACADLYLEFGVAFAVPTHD